MAHGFTSHFLRKLDENEIMDELRVIIDDNGTTAYFTFSSQMRPTLHHFRIYGPKNALIIDNDHQTTIKVRGKKFVSHLDKFIPPFIYAKQYISSSVYNSYEFLKMDSRFTSGRKFLIESFYRSILEDTPLPISYKEILLTSKIMDTIFQQIMHQI